VLPFIAINYVNFDEHFTQGIRESQEPPFLKYRQVVL